MHERDFREDTWKKLKRFFFDFFFTTVKIRKFWTLFSLTIFCLLYSVSRESGLSKNTTSDVGASQKQWRRRVKWVFSKICASKIWWGVSEVRFKKTRLLHLGNVEKPPNPQFSAQRAPERLVKNHFRQFLVGHFETWTYFKNGFP